MTPERYQELKKHYHAIADLDAGAQHSYLAGLSPVDRAEVASLLATGGEGFLEIPAGSAEPRQIGPYRIVREIGRGGMGVVYEAERDGESFAIKIMRWPLAGASLLHRFNQERGILSVLEHPNIAALIGAGNIEDGRPYFVMELVDGQQVDDYCSRLEIPDRLRLFERICRAIQYAHDRNIIHRDIKPPNILVTADGTPKLLDFGIAKVLNDADATRTQTGQRMMTPAYASPEQLRGESLTPRTDVYSLGVTLRELLGGGLRRAGAATTLAEGLETIVGHAVATEPSRRYGSAAELADAIDNYLSRTGDATWIPGPRHFVGREEEREEIERALRADHGCVIVVSGEAGLGKTALVEQVLLAHPDALIGIGRCSERLAGTEAYLPILDVLSSMATSDPRIEDRLGVCAPAWSHQLRSGARASSFVEPPPEERVQERLKRELLAFFEEASRDRPVIAFLDDLHWADASTVDAISYLSAHFTSLRLFIIVTVRPAELRLRNHALFALSNELLSRNRSRDIALSFLTAADVRHYMELEFAGNAFAPAFHELIFARTEGNALFVTDLLRYLRDERVIAKRDGVWQLERELGSLEKEIPLSARSMVDTKMAFLTDQERAVLVAASVQGMEFDSSIVASALEIDPAVAEELLGRLDRIHQFIRVLEEQEFSDGTPTLHCRFVHNLYQNAFFASMGPSARSSMSATIARTLLQRSAGRLAPVASQLAILFDAARDFRRAGEFFFLAAQHARRRFANREAELLAQRALDAIARLSGLDHGVLSGDIHELLGDIRGIAGRHDEARAAYDVSLTTMAGVEPLRRARLFRKRANTLVVQHAYANAAEAFDRARESLVPVDDHERSLEWIEIQLDRAWMFYWRADLRALDAIASETERAIERDATPLQRLRFLHVLTMAGFRRDRFAISDATLSIAQDAFRAAEALNEPGWVALTEFLLGFSHGWRNEIEQSERHLRSSLRNAEKIGDIVLQSRCLTYLTIAARKRRDDVATQQLAERTLAAAQEGGMPEYVAVAKANLGWLAWYHGDAANAVRLGHEAVALARELPFAGPTLWAAAFPTMDALLHLRRLDEAIEIARLAMDPAHPRFPTPVEDSLLRCLDKWESGDGAAAVQALVESCSNARETLVL